jgi:signal transduction histidine kinase
VLAGDQAACPVCDASGDVMRLFRLMLIWGMTVLMSMAAAAAEPRSRAALIIDESDPSNGAPTTFSRTLRATLYEFTPHIAVYGETLDVGRFAGLRHDELLRSYLREKYRDVQFGAIVAVGLAAFNLVEKWRAELWPGVPVVFAAIDELSAARLTPEPDVTGVVMHRTINSMMIAARLLVPDLKGVAVLGGTLERDAYRRQYLEELPALAHEIKVLNLTGLPLAEQLKSAAGLPDQTAILYTAFFIDNAGTIYSSADALSAIAEVANRPIVVDVDALVGRGATGGFALNNVAYGRQVASLTLRIIDGVGVDTIPVAVSEFTQPVFDWRQMQRWKISESSLPAGSEIRFREPSAWDRYRMPILAIVATVLVQAALICWLIFEHRRRHLAEVQSRNAMTELTYMNRRAAAGQLSASIAHEVNQPLTGIVLRASAALRWLGAETPNLERAKAALEQIVVSGNRAAEIIAGVRAMFRKDTSEFLPVDINKLILTVLAIVRIDLQKNDVDLQTQLDDKDLLVEGADVQLQQVVLNLVMNAIEAMQSVQPRVLTVKSAQSEPEMVHVHVSIEDTGTGVTRGAIFHFELPVKSDKRPAGTLAAQGRERQSDSVAGETHGSPPLSPLRPRSG